VSAALPPRWRIRRTWDGAWTVDIRRTFPASGHYVYQPVKEPGSTGKARTWDDWRDAIAYVNRAQTSNYGRAA
jgi:hypothetical protein